MDIREDRNLIWIFRLHTSQIHVALWSTENRSKNLLEEENRNINENDSHPHIRQVLIWTRTYVLIVDKGELFNEL